MSQEPSESTAHACRVLIVEDNPGDVYLIELTLREHVPCSLHVAEDGAEAVALLESLRAREELPDAIVLDLNVPCLSDRELLCALRGVERCQKIPIVIFTTAPPAELGSAAELGVSAILGKPFDADGYRALGEVVRRLVQCP